MTARAVAPVIGLVVLLGIAAITSMGLLVVGAEITEGTQSSAQEAQAERSLAQFAETADAVARGEASEGEFEIRGSDDADVRARPDAGWINVTVADGNGTRVFSINESLGVLVYEDGDTRIAHQGGGVWRKDGDGAARMVQAPQFHYREQPDPTLTFPIVRVTDEFSDSADVSGTLVARNTTTHYPDAPNHYNPLQNGSVSIEVHSEYCEGWEEFFRERTDGDVSESCENNGGAVLVTLSVPFVLDGVEGGAMVGDPSSVDTDDFDGINDTSDFGDSDDADSVTPLVEEEVETAKTEGDVLPDPDSVSEIDGPAPGETERIYYDDGNLSGNYNVTINTTNGDVVIASDQADVLSGHEDIDITGGGNVSIFAGGDLFMSGGGNGQIGEPGKEEQMRVYVHSEYDVGQGGQNTDFHGLLYAPNSDVDMGSGGGHNLTGAVAADTIDVGNAGWEIDSDTANINVNYTLGDAPFYYLHISETELTFRQD